MVPRHPVVPRRCAIAILITLCLLLLSSPIYAQYIYLDANQDGVNNDADVVQQVGTTTLDVFLRTNVTPDGSATFCPQDPEKPLSISSYTVVLRTKGGTVAWQSFQDLMSFPVPLAAGSSATELLAGFGSTSPLPPGTYHLGRVALTVTGGVPKIEIVSQTSFNDTDWTSFGTSCYGNNFDNIMRLGMDWVGADGVGNAANRAPTLGPIADMVVDEGEVATQTFTATDADGDDVELTQIMGPYYMRFSVDPLVPSPTVTGTIRLAPQLNPYNSFARIDTAAFMASDGYVTVRDTSFIFVRPGFSAALLNGWYDMRVVAGQTAVETVNADDPDGDASEIVFEMVAGPSYASVATLPLVDASTAQGEVRLTPAISDIGASSVTFVALKGTLRAEGTIGITVLETAPANTAPTIPLIPDLLIPLGTGRSFGAGAQDADGDLLTPRLLLAPDYVTFRPYGYPGGASFLIEIRPTAADLGTARVEIGVADGYVETRRSFNVTVSPPNHPPDADVGGPYGGTVGRPIMFDGSGSTDPDGDVLSFFWLFGDGASGTGVHPEHAYKAPATYSVQLTVRDGVTQDQAATTATVTSVLDARAFTLGDPRSVALVGAAQPHLSIFLEPIEGSYLNEDLDKASIVMRSEGTGAIDEIHAEIGKTHRIGDRDHDGVDELELHFTGADLASLFSDLDGRMQVSVTIEGSLWSGVRLQAPLTLRVVATGRTPNLRIYPNPLNPSGTIGIVLTAAGPLEVRLFNVSGQLVRVLTHESWSPAGYREVPFDGLDGKGSPLASGIYFYRLKSAGGTLTGRLTIAR